MILDQFKLDGKTAIVTGGARGLGRGMAEGLAQAGADVVLVDVLDMSEAQKTISGWGRRCATLTADLSRRESADQVVSFAKEKMGGIDILVNNAGIIRRAPLLEFSVKDWDDVMNINLRTLFFLSQAVARVMVEQGRGGKIVRPMLSFLRHSGAVVHLVQKRSDGADPPHGQRAGAPFHQRQRRGSGLYGHGQHRSAAPGQPTQL